MDRLLVKRLLLLQLLLLVLLQTPDPVRAQREHHTRRSLERRVPSSPLNLNVTKVTSTEIHLTWAKPSGFGEPPQETIAPLEDGDEARIVPVSRKKRTKRPEANDTAEDSALLDYLLYYEEGLSGDEPNAWTGESLQTALEVRSALNTVRLAHKDKDGLKGVRYTLRKLKPYTYYRIWVRAYFASSAEKTDAHLGDRSLRVTCVTDVPPPSVPKLSNLTCDQPPGTLHIGWIKPDNFVKNISYYTIILKRHGPSSSTQVILVETSHDHLETSINLSVEILNNQSNYEISIYASSPSIVEDGLLINGTKTKPHNIEMTPDCVAYLPVKEASSAPLFKIISLLIILIFGFVIILIIIYYRGCVTVFKKCYPMSYLFLEEGVTIGGDGCGENGTLGKTESQINCPNKKVTSPEHALVFWGASKNKNGIESNSEQLWDALHPPVPADKFFAHTAALHADGDIGFSKEYELIQSKSSMLSHTSHHSHHPDNRHKNRYLNITAYDHSRVCLLPSSSCFCEPGKEHRKSCTSKPNSPPVDSPSHCDYVNANFIDGIVAEIDTELAKYIIDQNSKRKMIKTKQEAADSLTTASQPTSELWISVDESQRPFNYMCTKTIINDNADMTASLTSETKNLLGEKSIQNTYSNAIKGKLSLDLDKKEDKKVLTPSSDILANTCRLSINLDRRDDKQDDFKTEKLSKESKSKKRSTSADTRDIIVDKKSSSRGHSKNSSVVVTANDNSPSNVAPKIEGAFLNIEFSGIVDSEKELQKAKEAEKMTDISKLAKDNAEETLEDLDDLYVQIDGESYRVNSSWLLDRRRYIGTQGPTPGTLPAFWRMVWDHQVVVIVMITNLIERGRRKCDMYWPKEGSEIYGVIQVNTIKEDVMATYTIRTFQIKNTINGLSRQVLQYHYTVWPDHGTPEHPLAVLRFREAARKSVAPQAGAVLVHCSAGVGRTGTYIVLDAMLNHLRLTGSLNVFGFLCHVRSQRNFLVQTEEQYVFIHDALLEAIQSGDTEVPAESAKEYLHKLLEPFPEDYISNFLSNSKCGPYGAPLLEKVSDYQNIDSIIPFNYNGKIKQANNGECDFNIWNNVNDTQFNNDKTLEECRNDIVSVSLQEAKTEFENNSKINRNESPKVEKLLNGNIEDVHQINDFDGNVDMKTFDNSSELLLDNGKEDKNILNCEDSISNKLKVETNSDKIETTSINSINLVKSDHSTSYEKINGLCAKVSEESKASSVSNDEIELLPNENNSNGLPNIEEKNCDANPEIPSNGDNSNTITSSISSDTNNINNDGSFKDKRSSNFSPVQYGSNQENSDNLRKDKNYRSKNYENYELLGGSGRPGGLGGANVDCFAGAHRFACQKKDTSGKKPKNLLEHQFKLITSFEPSKFHTVNASKQVNLSKNRRGCVLPIESGRVHLIPKPGIEGSDYINATWLQGHRSLKEYIVTQHPLPATVGDLYRMLWDHSCQILVVLSNCSYDPECKPFWPTEKNPEISTYNFNIRFLSEEKLLAKRLSPCDLNNKKNLHKLLEDDSSQESPLQSPSSLSSNKEFSIKVTKNSQKASPSSSNSEQRKSSQYSPKETSERNGSNGKHVVDNDSSFYKRQCSTENQDEERLIPKSDDCITECPEEIDELKKLNIDTKTEGYAFDKTELRIETFMSNDVKSGKSSPLKHEVNGDPHTPDEDISKKSQTKSPSKLSLKSLRLNSPILKSPTKFKFEFGTKNKVEEGRKSPQSIVENATSFDPKFAMTPLLSLSQLRESSEEIGLDCVITTTNISINSLQDDYELKVKLIECPRWLGDLDYDENSDTDDDSEDEEYEMEEKALDYVIDQRLRAYKGVYGLPEYVTRCQDDAKNSPVVVVDKTGGARAVALCTLTGVLRRQSRDLYTLAKLHHGRRAGTWRRASDIRALYEALAAYEHPPPPTVSNQS